MAQHPVGADHGAEMGVPRRKARRRKPAPKPSPVAKLVTPDFKPPTVSPPKPKSKPRSRPQPKRGPYSKPKPKPYKIGVTAYVPGPTSNSEVKVSPKHPKGAVVWAGSDVPMSDQDLYESRNQERLGAPPKQYKNRLKKSEGATYGHSGNAVRMADKKPKPIHTEGSGLGGGGLGIGRLDLPGSSYVQPVGKVTKAVVENLPDYTLGPGITRALEGKGVNKAQVGIDAAMLFPVFRGVGRAAQVAEHIAQGLHAGEDIEHVITGARQVARHGKLPEDRFIHVGGGHYVRAPAAPQIQVRTAQKILDRNVERQVEKAAAKGLHHQEALGRSGLASTLKHPIQGAARKRVERLTERVGFYENKATEAVPQSLKHLKLNAVQKVTIRQIARNTHPNMEIAANEKRIEQAIERGDTKAVADLRRDNELLRHSRHYLEGSGSATDKMRLRTGNDKATKRLNEALTETRRLQKQGAEVMIKAGEFDTPQIKQALAEGMITREEANSFARQELQKRVDKPGAMSRELVGHEGEHAGGFYYPSKPEGKKPLSGAFSGKGMAYAFKKRGESKAPYEGILQAQGRENPDVPGVVGAQAAFRLKKALYDKRVEELRPFGMNKLPSFAKSAEDLNDTYALLRTTATPNSSASVRMLEILHDLDRGADMSNSQLEAFGSSLKQWRDEYIRTPSEVIRDGQIPKEYTLVHKSLLGALRDPKVFSARELTKFSRTMMDISTVAKDMVVYTKIGHMPPRLISNVLMALPDTGADFFRGLHAMWWLRKNRPDLLKFVHQAMGGGYYKSIAETTGMPHRAVKGLSKGLVGWIEFTADRAPRNAAFLAFAIKDSGAKSPQELARYLESLRSAEHGTEAWAARTRVMDHARQAAGEYERVGRDASIGNILFLYRWLKAATIWTGRFAVKHPILGAGVGYGVSQYGYDPTQPIYGRFNVKGHNYTTSVPFSTPVEIGERLNTLPRSGKTPLGENLADMVNPALAAGFAAVTHHDIETGDVVKGVPAVAAAKGFLGQVPLYNVVSGKHSLKYRLEKFLGGNFLPHQEIAGPPALKDTLAKLVEQGKMTPAEARAVSGQVESLKKKIPKLEAKLKAQLDVLVEKHQLDAKKEHSILTRLHNTVPNLEKRLEKASESK